jgi:steroid 5-alpha reductase family enzyme
MKRKLTWWKLYAFAAMACVVLFLIPPTNQTLLMLWMMVMFGGIVVWLKTNEAQLAESVDYQPTVVKPPVSEFFDEDRVYLQQLGTEIRDDNLHGSPHEAA